PETASPKRSPSGRSRSSASRKRSISSAAGLSAAGDLAAAAVILLSEPPRRDRRVGFAEFGEGDAGAVGVVQRDHRFGEVQQAVGRAVTILDVLIVLEEVGCRFTGLAVIEIRAA